MGLVAIIMKLIRPVMPEVELAVVARYHSAASLNYDLGFVAEQS